MNINRTIRTTTFLFAFALAIPMAWSQGTNDPDFNVGTGANGQVAAAALQIDGKVLIGGAFTTYNGTAINRVARLNLDGSLDAGFTPGTAANSQVNTVALTSTGKIMIGGTFTSYDGTARNRIARLNADGTVDTGFAPGTGFNNTVTQVAVQSDDKVIVVGDFTSFNGTGRVRVARLNTDGSLDTGFNPGTGANFLVTCATIQSDGKVLIGGYFNDYNGTAVVALARLNSDGSLDTGYNSGGAGPNDAVNAISLLSDGKALVAGRFTTYNGTGRNRILRANTNGTLDSGFNPGTGANGEVLAIAQQSDGAIILGGVFTTFDGVTHNRHCRIGSTGTVDATWTTGSNNGINCLLWMPEGRLVVGGIFTNIAAAARNRITRFKALCTDDVDLIITTDGAGAETGWQLIPYGYQYAAYSGTGLANNSVVTVGGCLALGCYQLKVTDSGPNGITGGGYVLKSQSGDRIIDCTANFSAGALSQISGAQGGPDNFCVAIGTHKPIYVSRDKLDWVNNEYIVASENTTVSQVWTDFGSGSPERASTGYDFWFYNPNGSYTYVRQRRHSSSDGFAPANATRACHMKINSWAAVNHIPANTLMNVRMRTVVLGVASAWGPAYQFKIDPVRASCPLTKLMDIPGNAYLSCGQPRDWGSGNYIHARPVTGANKYQFRFKLLDNTYVTTRTTTTYFLQLNWGATPLVPGTTYKVDVRASFDGGATWCSDFIPPALDPWGDVCTLIINSSFTGDVHRVAMEVSATAEESIAVWPNPSNGEAINLNVSGIELVDEPLRIAVIDATGRMVHEASMTSTSGDWSGSIAFPAQLEAGAYVVRVSNGAQQWMARWVVQQ